jgi:O-antigen ligase
MTASAQARRSNITWWLWFTGVVGITGSIGLALLGGVPNPAVIGWLCFFIGIIAIIYQPRYGVYLIVGLALVGDSLLNPWYPFVKNLSSAESLLYLGRATSFSPAEIYITLTFVSWLGRAAMRRKLKMYTGALFWPMLIFSAFVTLGLMYGLLNHGNSTVALWEVRVIYYLPMLLILTSNLLATRAHFNHLIWVIIIALFLDGLSGLWFVASELNFDLHSVEAIAEHSYSIHLNTLFVLTIAVWLFRGSRVKRIVLPLLIPVIAISYFANQRRASYITLAIALLLIAIVLYRENRKAFWLIIPIACVAGAIYLAVFWNSSGGIGGPARAIRSIIAPQPGGRDDSSNVYRVIENLNTKFTIKARPLTGVGFGNKFYIVAPLPDISFFIWWEYMTHNSILWIWMQAGVGGFISMLFLIGLSILVGVRTLWRMPGGDMSAIALMATLYIVMHFIYAYVDISWEAQSMIYVGAMMGLLNSMERIVAGPIPLPRKLWSWQSAQVPEAKPQPLQKR